MRSALILRFLAGGLLPAVMLLALASGADASYLESPKAKAFINEMVRDHGFDRRQMQRWMADASRQQSIIDAMNRPAEKVLQWKGYRKIFLTPERISGGRKFIASHRKAFDRAWKTYGVPPAIIAAIIGVETGYGRFTGKYRVIDALATLAFDYPPRSRFFRDQLAQFFILAREQDFDPLTLRGSYAGAMGYGQFIPSSYRHFAVDFDGDHVADIIGDPVDAIGSVANYFRAHGWKKGQPLVDPVNVSQSVAARVSTSGLKPVDTVADFRRAGIRVGVHVDDRAPARLLRLEGAGGTEYFVTYHNFYVITRYNHSPLYAMAVTDLAARLDETGPDKDRVAGR